MHVRGFLIVIYYAVRVFFLSFFPYEGPKHSWPLSFSLSSTLPSILSAHLLHSACIPAVVEGKVCFFLRSWGDGLATHAWRRPYALPRYIGGTRPGFTAWSVKLLRHREWFHRRIKTLAALHSH